MYVGDQNFGVTPQELEFLTRHGVCHIDANRGLPKPLTLEAMIAHRETAAAYGVQLEMIHVLPGRATILGKEPQTKSKDNTSKDDPKKRQHDSNDDNSKKVRSS